jgi:hypothetical protein
MTISELGLISSVMIGLAVVRFGLPILVIWLFRYLYGQLIHVRV